MKQLYCLIIISVFGFSTAFSQQADTIILDTYHHQIIEDSTIFAVVQKMPQFPGGDDARFKYIAENITYPPEALNKGIEGRVFVTFIVEKDGSISNIKTLRGIGSGCDEEAMRIVSNMPRWEPGTQRGKPVRVQFNMPILFQISGNKTQPFNSSNYDTGLKFLNSEAYKEAIDAFSLSIKSADEHQKEAYFMRAVANYQLGNYYEAANDLMTAQNIEAEVDQFQLSNLMFLVANELLIQGKFDYAITVYDRCIEINPQNGKAFINRAITYQKKGNEKAAKADFKMAQQLGVNILE
ncbi:MAG TPA: TonB family protein [Bacteroidales bacterium]|nr:TonB family protein [Bacteroidales bacterium]HRX96526.1 TonB family protein [Bacteroidales bacterium]